MQAFQQSQRSSSQSRRAARPDRSRAAAALAPALVVLGAVNVATAIWAVADHASFAERVAPFGPLNGHLIDDYAAASGTFGAALLVAAVRAAWRVPLIAVTALWTALHAVSHIAAADDVGAGATGPVEAVALVAATVVLIGMLVVAEHDP